MCSILGRFSAAGAECWPSRFYVGSENLGDTQAEPNSLQGEPRGSVPLVWDSGRRRSAGPSGECTPGACIFPTRLAWGPLSSGGGEGSRGHPGTVTRGHQNGAGLHRGVIGPPESKAPLRSRRPSLLSDVMTASRWVPWGALGPDPLPHPLRQSPFVDAHEIRKTKYPEPKITFTKVSTGWICPQAGSRQRPGRNNLRFPGT